MRFIRDIIESHQQLAQEHGSNGEMDPNTSAPSSQSWSASSEFEDILEDAACPEAHAGRDGSHDTTSLYGSGEDERSGSPDAQISARIGVRHGSHAQSDNSLGAEPEQKDYNEQDADTDDILGNLGPQDPAPDTFVIPKVARVTREPKSWGDAALVGEDETFDTRGLDASLGHHDQISSQGRDLDVLPQADYGKDPMDEESRSLGSFDEAVTVAGVSGRIKTAGSDTSARQEEDQIFHPHQEREDEVQKKPDVVEHQREVPLPLRERSEKSDSGSRVVEELATPVSAHPSAIIPSQMRDAPMSFPSINSSEDPVGDPSKANSKSARTKTRLLGFGSAASSADPIERLSNVDQGQDMRFPVGWVVVVDGPGRGHAFQLGLGVNQIGRAEDQSIRLDFGDTAISRNNHAAVAFDVEQNAFFIGHGGKANIVRRNNRPVLSTEELVSGDTIRVGETTLRFVPLCGADFSWTDEQHPGTSRALG